MNTYVRSCVYLDRNSLNVCKGEAYVLCSMHCLLKSYDIQITKLHGAICRLNFQYEYYSTLNSGFPNTFENYRTINSDFSKASEDYQSLFLLIIKCFST
jgi:hypothetical protein